MKTTRIFISILYSLSLISCSDSVKYDATGIFEATETIISAEANGRILELNLEEGDILKKDQLVGFIDSTQLHLNWQQLTQNKVAILAGRPDVKTQIESLEKDLENALNDLQRTENLVKGGVASQKQLDDANTRVMVLRSKIAAMRNTLATTTSTLNEQSGTVSVQLKQVEDQLRKCRITNPVNGTVLVKYAEENEMTSSGRALYKIADLSNMILRAYITGEQLPEVKTGQQLKVLLDSADTYREVPGTITWISDKAEFTPKTIQTKEERANLVYALKIQVKNDGRIKSGMFAEVKL